MSVLVQTEHEAVHTLTLKRPEKRNALNLELWAALRDALKSLRKDDARCVVINGAGLAFCAGGDWVEASNAEPDYLERVYEIPTRSCSHSTLCLARQLQ